MSYKELHLVERFFNQIKRFRRNARRCEATISSFKAFVDIACTMERISQMQTPPEAQFEKPESHFAA